MARLSNVRAAIQKVKPHVIGIKFPTRQPWTPIIPTSGPVIPDDILNLTIAAKAVVPPAAPIAAAPVAATRTKPAAPKPVSSQAPLLRHGKPKYEDVPVTNIRTVIAKRLTESKQTVPHQYTSVKVNVLNAITLRQTLKEQGIKISMNDLVLKATAIALTKVPQLNAVWTGEESRQLNKVDMCMAVATENGLFAPCLKNVEKMGLVKVNEAVKDIAGRARTGKLKPDELSGGGFTVSNLGMFGITEFTAIINPPQAGILAVSGIEESFTADGKLSEMTLTLSADGRAVGMDDAFEFCQKLKEILENPRIMLML